MLHFNLRPLHMTVTFLWLTENLVMLVNEFVLSTQIVVQSSRTN
jgi:hypothetical protein